MRYGLKLSLALILTLGCAVLVGTAATLGYLLGGSYAFTGAAFAALCGCCGGALWWHHLVADRAERELATYLKMSAPKPVAHLQIILPGDVDVLQQRLTDMLGTIGHGCADAIELGREINRGMAEVGSHLAGVEAERDRYKIEAEKVREIAAVAARPMRRLPDIHDTLGHKAGPDAYGRKGAMLPEEVPGVMPAFLHAPRLVERVAHPDRLKVDLAEIEEAIKTAAPAGG